MKKIAVIIIITLISTSCQKKYCWKCTISSQANGGLSSSTTTTTVCDKAESEIRDYEKAATMITSSSGITVNTSTRCQK
jgi:hypothetical protein